MCICTIVFLPSYLFLDVWHVSRFCLLGLSCKEHVLQMSLLYCFWGLGVDFKKWNCGVNGSSISSSLVFFRDVQIVVWKGWTNEPSHQKWMSVPYSRICANQHWLFLFFLKSTSFCGVCWTSHCCFDFQFPNN